MRACEPQWRAKGEDAVADHSVACSEQVGLIPAIAVGMQSKLWMTLCLFIIGCGGPQKTHEHTTLSVDEHRRQADEHDVQAEINQGRMESGSGEGAVDVRCYDQGPPLNIGSEEVAVMKPCWTRPEENAAYARAAERERKSAKEHRAWAQLLIDVEKTACQGLGEVESHTSPFLRKPDILSVEEYRASGELRGAKIRFRKVKGLSKDWFGKSIRCHQARSATLGYAKDFMTHCPLVLEKTSVSIIEDDTSFTITLRSTDPIVAAEIYGRSLRAAE